MNRKLGFSSLAILLLLLLAACASTTLRSAWFDTSFKGGPFREILVVGVGTNATQQRVFEDIFAQKLSAAGTVGVPGYQFLSDNARVNDAGWNAGIEQSGADGLLLVRVLGVDNRTRVTTTMVPANTMGFGPNWGNWWGPTMVAVPEVSQYEIANVETTLFDVKTRHVVWSGTTETFNPTTVARETPGFADLIIGQLSARGLVVAKS